jgi:hypothetical protein
MLLVLLAHRRHHLCRLRSRERSVVLRYPPATRKEKVMSRRIAALVVMGITLGVGSAFAQESAPGPGAVEVTYMPASAAYFTSKGDSPSFGNYGFGSAVTFNLTPLVGVEGEIGAMIATTSDLQFGDLNSHVKAPNALSYAANFMLSPWTGHSFVPYATVGIGALTMFERPELDVTSDETSLAGNVGGGIKWYAANSRWGLRGDYRVAVTQSRNDAFGTFDPDTRYVHRVYAGVIINTKR